MNNRKSFRRERRLEGKSSSKQHSTSCHPQSTRLMEHPFVNDLLWLQIQIVVCWCHLPKLKLIKNTLLPSAIISSLASSGVAHSVRLKAMRFKGSWIRNIQSCADSNKNETFLIEISSNVTFGRRWWMLCDMCCYLKHQCNYMPGFSFGYDVHFSWDIIHSAISGIYYCHDWAQTAWENDFSL